MFVWLGVCWSEFVWLDVGFLYMMFVFVCVYRHLLFPILSDPNTTSNPNITHTPTSIPTMTLFAIWACDVRWWLSVEGSKIFIFPPTNRPPTQKTISQLGCVPWLCCPYLLLLHPLHSPRPTPCPFRSTSLSVPDTRRHHPTITQCGG